MKKIKQNDVYGGVGRNVGVCTGVGARDATGGVFAGVGCVIFISIDTAMLILGCRKRVCCCV